MLAGPLADSVALSMATLVGLVALARGLRRADRSAIWMALHLGGLALFVAAGGGPAPGSTNPVSQLAMDWLQSGARLLALSFGALLVADAAGLRHSRPPWAGLLTAYALVLLLVPALSGMFSFAPPAVVAGLVDLLTLTGAVTLPGAAIVGWRLGSRPAAYVAIAISPLMLVMVTNVILTMAAASGQTVAGGYAVAVAFESAVLGLALLEQAVRMRRERRGAWRHCEVDPVTGLLGLAVWQREFPVFAQHLQSRGERVFVMMLAVDPAGPGSGARAARCADENALARIGEILRRSCQPGGLICRSEAESFLLALRAAGLAEARARAEAVRAEIARQHLHCAWSGQLLTLNIGLARHRSGATLEATLERVRAALAAARAARPEDGLVSAEAV